MPTGHKIITDENKDAAFADVGGQKVLKVFDVGDIIDPETGTGFKKPSYASSFSQIQKGGKTKLEITPRVLGENVTVHADVVQTLGGSITDVGQIVRLTPGINNVDRVRLTLEAIAGGAITSIDDFESYADTTALRAAWEPNDTTNTPNTLETTIVAEGAKAMAIQMLNKTKSKSDEAKFTYGATQDWSSLDGIKMQFRNDTPAIIEVHIIDDNGDGSKHTITTSVQGAFELLQLDFNNFIPVGAVSADLTMVKEVKFFVKTAAVGFFFVDAIELFENASFGTADLELYDFGSTSTPTTLAEGTLKKTVTIDLVPGKVLYEVPLNVDGLSPNTHLGIVLTNPSVATVKVYGDQGNNIYSSGFAFDSADDDNIGETATGDDIFFNIFSKDQAVFHGIRFVVNANPGDESKLTAFIQDKITGVSRTSLFVGERTMQRKEIEFPTQQQTLVQIKMSADEIIEIDYEDDGSQLNLATKLQATAYLTFIDRPLNG